MVPAQYSVLRVYTIHIDRELNHPNILSILGVISDGASVTLITNYVMGGNLHTRIFADDYPQVNPLHL